MKAIGDGIANLPWSKPYEIAQRLFEMRGVPTGDASLVADTLVRADARGIRSLTLMRTSFYYPKLDQGTMLPVATLRHIAELRAVGQFNGGNEVVLVKHPGVKVDSWAWPHTYP